MESAASTRPNTSSSGTLELLGLGTGLVLVMVLLGRVPSWRAELGTFQALDVAAFAFFLVAVLRLDRYRHAPRAGAVVLAVAVAARLALLPAAPSLSYDVDRYVWEGRVVVNGQNPYALAPAAPELRGLRDPEIFPRVNHPELATIYPPVAIAGFALVAALSPTVLAMKLWIVLHDLALVAALLLLCHRRGLGSAAALAYAWCPLPLVEFAGSGHHDPTSMVWLVLALLWVEKHPLGSALALSLGVLTKLAPLVALPFLWARWSWRARNVSVLTLAAGLGLFLALTRGADSGLAAYARSWRNNELLFDLLAVALRGEMLARIAAAAIVALVVAILMARGTEAAEGTRTTLRAGLLVSPVAHPWYFAWTMLLEPVGRAPVWWLLSLTCVLSYGLFAPPAEGGAFHLPLPWRWIEYGVPLVFASALSSRTRQS